MRGQAQAHASQPLSSSSAARGRGFLLSWLQAPFFALEFLTIVPLPVVRQPPEAADFGRSESFFPLVGLLLGTSLALTDRLLEPVVVDPARAVLLVAMLAILTGALHLDGLVDTFDGTLVGPDRERRLAVMRDPRAGSYGVVAVTLLLALKVAAISSLPTELRSPALVLAPCLGRWGIVLATAVYPYARPEGSGRAFKDSLRLPHVMIASLITVGSSVALASLGGIALVMVTSVAVLLAGRWLVARLGGLTGDTYGAICELVEAGTLVALGLRLGSMAG